MVCSNSDVSKMYSVAIVTGTRKNEGGILPHDIPDRVKIAIQVFGIWKLKRLEFLVSMYLGMNEAGVNFAHFPSD